MTLAQIGALVGGEIHGGDGTVEIERVAKIEEARAGDIAFLANPKYRKHVATTRASALLVDRTSEFPELGTRTSPPALVRCDDPYRAFLRLIDLFHPPPDPVPAGIHPTAVVASSAVIGPGSAVGPHVVIGERCTIGERCRIDAGSVLGADVELGDDSRLAANVNIRERCRIGRRAVIHAGAVIGADGFGFAPAPDGTYEKIPQRGIVVIEDDVEIGANTTVDRATLGETRIARGVKLDNLIQVGHNAYIGEHTVIAAQSGISGSTRIGKHCRVAGQVGFAGHLEIADNTTFAAQTGVPKSLLKEGESYFGTPARESRQRLRIEAALTELPELLVQVRSLREKLDRLEQELARLAHRSTNT